MKLSELRALMIEYIGPYADSYFGIDEIDEILDDKNIPSNFEVIEAGEWIQDYKYQHCTLTVRDTSDNTYFQIDNSRAGSYHTDWYYQTPTIQQVEPKEVIKTITTTSWHVVKGE